MKGTFAHTIWSSQYLKALQFFCLIGTAALLVLFKDFPRIFYLVGSANVTAIFGIVILSFFQTSHEQRNQQVTGSFFLMLVQVHGALHLAPDLALAQSCFIISSLGYAMLLRNPEELGWYLGIQTLLVGINITTAPAELATTLPFLFVYCLASGFFYLLISRMLKKQRELWLLKVQESNVRAELEEQSRRLQEVQYVHDLARSMVCEIDYTGYFLQVNSAFCDKTGYSERELLSIPYSEFVHPEDVRRTGDLIRTLSSSAQNTPDFVNRFITRTGEVLHFQWNACVDEERSTICCVVTDISKEKQSEESLIAYQTRLKALFDQNTVGIILATLDGDIVMANPAMGSVLGYSSAELGKTSIQNLTLPSDRHVVTDCIYLLTSGESASYNFEKRCLRKDGSVCWVHVEIGLMNSEHGNPDYLVCTIIDISEQKRAEADLRASEAYLLQAQQIGKIGHWSIDVADMTPVWSEESYRIHDLHASSTPSLEASIDLYDEASRETMIEAYTCCLSEGKSFDLILRLNEGTHGHKWVRSIGSPQYEEREITRIFGIFQDVTDQVEVERALTDARLEAERAAQAKTQFLSNMSHEIRTPLNALIGATHLMLQEAPRPDQREMLEILAFSGNNLLALVNDILDYNKIEAGKLTLELIDTDLPKLLTTVVQSHRFKAQERGIDLRLEIETSTPVMIKGDPVRLTQIMNNLVSNAIKFTDDGEVVIRTKSDTSSGHRMTLIIEVQDSGIGIQAENLDMVFGSFTQASAETTRKYGGTGLGLAISRNLVHLMGGQLSVISEPQKGSTFTVTMEADRGEQHPEQTREIVREDDQMPLKDIKVLLVEDNTVNVTIASRFLEKWGAGVVSLSNGAQAVSFVENHRVDLILMDIRMPVMGGMEATQAIRKFNQDTPIVALSASTLAEVIKEFRGTGFDGFVSKPFRPAELLEEIRRLVNPCATH